MADITMCRNHDCPKANQCRRFCALPNPYRQSYSEFKPNAEGVCIYFWVNPEKYDLEGEFHEGRASVRLDGKFGFVDEEGNEVIPLKYDGVGNFREGRAAVNLNRKWGFVDLQGNEVIPLKYDYAGSFFYGKAAIRIGDCSGEVALNGKEYFRPQDRAMLRKAKIERLLKDLSVFLKNPFTLI
jgi:hypothetical protein